ncbi:uncharacterized protein [Nerophis lumbriciformis]|uniref:uncharacterized protein n=1 Tax=Nerophis lumbriciformis TaxID=546530 RepID=UPI002ADF2E55|nr:uncharacterized protein LOC133575797 [Nerophis lumbriciformis]
MTSQRYLTVYREQFASPGRVERTPLRPTSAHRRNNPQPKPDFLFPRNLKTCTKPWHRPLQPTCPVFTGRPFLPPVRLLSSYSPVKTCPVDAAGPRRPQHMPAINPPAVQDLQKQPFPACVQVHSARKHGGLHPWKKSDIRDSLPAQQTTSSCFHVVKPRQAARYVIHPQFVSEPRH